MTATLADEIRLRGFWQIIVRPTEHRERRIDDISALWPLVQGSSVQLRGWDFPHVDPQHRQAIGLNWIGQETDWEHFRELWRIYQSGQFFSLCGMIDDWRDRSGWWKPDPGWAPGKRLGVGDTLARFTEFFEFAARLSTTSAGDESMHIEVQAGNIADRILFVDAPLRAGLHWRPKATINEFPYVIDLARTDLIANPRQHALDGAMELFKRFGWEGTVDVLRDWQAEFKRQ